MFGIDYATHVNNLSCFNSKGVKFVCRYLAPVGKTYDWKRLTPSEVKEIKAKKMGLVLVFESSAKRALGGKQSGLEDGTTAFHAIKNLGLPPDSPVYFAVDFDATEAQQPYINAYLSGAASVIGRNRTGVYGGYYICQRALNAAVCAYAWQTYAWSGGKWLKRAHIQQYRNGQNICGVQVDFDRSMYTDYGQVKFDKPVPKVKPYKVEVTNKDGTKVYQQNGRIGVLFSINRFLTGKFKEVKVTRL